MQGTGNSKGMHGQMLHELVERYLPCIATVVGRCFAHDLSVMKLLEEQSQGKDL